MAPKTNFQQRQRFQSFKNLRNDIMITKTLINDHTQTVLGITTDPGKDRNNGRSFLMRDDLKHAHQPFYGW